MSNYHPEIVKITYALLGDHYSTFLPESARFQFWDNEVPDKAVDALIKTSNIFRRKKGDDYFSENSVTFYSKYRNIVYLVLKENDSITVMSFNKRGEISMYPGCVDAKDAVSRIALISAPMAEFLTDGCNMYEYLEKIINNWRKSRIEITKTDNTILLELPKSDTIAESYLKLTVEPETELVTVERKHVTNITKLEYTTQTKDLLDLNKEINVFQSLA